MHPDPCSSAGHPVIPPPPPPRESKAERSTVEMRAAKAFGEFVKTYGRCLHERVELVGFTCPFGGEGSFKNVPFERVGGFHLPFWWCRAKVGAFVGPVLSGGAGGLRGWAVFGGSFRVVWGSPVGFWGGVGFGANGQEPTSTLTFPKGNPKRDGLCMI